MKLIYIFITLCYTGFGFAQIILPTTDPHYILIWEDEFSGGTLNSNIWKKRDWWDNGSKKHDPNKTSPSITLADNVEVSGGTLKLHLKRETISCGVDYNDEWGYVVDNLSNNSYCTFQQEHGIPYEFSGAEIVTKVPYQNSYGYYEARVRMTAEYGTWNSFWTFRGSLIPNINVPNNAGEIDIYETVGRSRNPDLIKTNIHTAYCPAGDEYDPTSFAHTFTGGLYDCGSKGVGNLCEGTPENGDVATYDENVCTNDITKWHTYGLELTPTTITWFIDGIPVRDTTNVGIHTDIWVEFGLIVDPQNEPEDMTAFDFVQEVDYFRFYELNQDCDAIIDDCSFWFGGHENKVKKSIKIGEGGCGNIQPINTELILRAEEKVSIYGNFEVPLGSEFTIITGDKNCYD